MAPDPDSVSAAAVTGDRLKTLVALRDRLAQDIDNPMTSPRDRAALSRQFTAVLSEIAEEATPTKESPLDELRKRREARRRSA